MNDILKFLEKITKDPDYREKSQNECNMLAQLMVRGFSGDSLLKKYKGSMGDLSAKLEFAASRNSVKNKFSRYEELWLDRYSASYSTPENVGIYRSMKLKGHDIADLGSGAGMQAIFLSMNSSVTGIERNIERHFMSNLNRIPYESDCTFIPGDATSSLEILKGVDTIFSDPLRSSSSGERRLENLEPSPLKLISLFENKVQNFVFDLPPMLKRDKISKLKGELEYISVNGRISRLTLYSMDQSENKTVAYSLSTGKRFESVEFKEPGRVEAAASLIFVPDESLFYSGLHGTYCTMLGINLLHDEKRKSLYTGDTVIPEFMGEIYKVEKTCEIGTLKENLFSLGAGKVIIRFDTPDYYKLKGELENGLVGERVMHVFRIGDTTILCSELNSDPEVDI